MVVNIFLALEKAFCFKAKNGKLRMAKYGIVSCARKTCPDFFG